MFNILSIIEIVKNYHKLIISFLAIFAIAYTYYVFNDRAELVEEAKEIHYTIEQIEKAKKENNKTTAKYNKIRKETAVKLNKVDNKVDYKDLTKQVNKKIEEYNNVK